MIGMCSFAFRICHKHNTDYSNIKRYYVWKMYYLLPFFCTFSAPKQWSCCNNCPVVNCTCRHCSAVRVQGMKSISKLRKWRDSTKIRKKYKVSKLKSAGGERIRGSNRAGIVFIRMLLVIWLQWLPQCNL